MRRLLILGGGYGGLKVLLNVMNQKLPDDVQITLIDKNPYHSLKTEFYTIAAGTCSDQTVRLQFPKDGNIEYIFSEVTSIDIENQRVIVDKADQIIPYDYLVIALGSEDNYHGIEGTEEFTESVQSFSKARYTGLSVGNLKAYGRVSVVGAGLTGIEVASEIRESRPDLNIRLLDRGSAVLRSFDPKIQTHVHDWFRENDVEVLHHANVEYVEKDGVCNNGICYVNDVTIWTAGVRPHWLVRNLPVEKDRYEQVVVNEYYQIPEKPNVYVVGDCASSEFSPSGQLAGIQGEHVAEILANVTAGKAPKTPPPIRLKGTLGSLGKTDGFGSMFQWSLTGLLPRLAKSGVLWLGKRH